MTISGVLGPKSCESLKSEVYLSGSVIFQASYKLKTYDLAAAFAIASKPKHVPHNLKKKNHVKKKFQSKDEVFTKRTG